MTDWQKRVVAELDDLSGKVERLKLFCATSAWSALPADEKDRLRRQLAHMQAYQDVLGERIVNFVVEETK